jgi:hypothetical protein
LLGLSAVLLVSSNPWQFFQAIEGSFFDWTEIFWYLQWCGFWVLSASLLLFGWLAWHQPEMFALGWKMIPVGPALAMFVTFLACSMPEKSNEEDWKNGWLGARVYLRTKIWMRGDEAGEDAIADRLQGDWEVPGGFAFIISREGVRIESPEGASVWNERNCRHRFRMDYDFAFRTNLELASPGGLGFRRFDQARRTRAISLPDRRFPRLSCSCDSMYASWVLVDIDRLMAFPESGTVLHARRR